MNLFRFHSLPQCPFCSMISLDPVTVLRLCWAMRVFQTFLIFDEPDSVWCPGQKFCKSQNWSLSDFLPQPLGWGYRFYRGRPQWKVSFLWHHSLYTHWQHNLKTGCQSCTGHASTRLLYGQVILLLLYHLNWPILLGNEVKFKKKKWVSLHSVEWSPHIKYCCCCYC